MAFKANVITPTKEGGNKPSKDSGGPGLGKSATGGIRSDSFLVAPDLQPGSIQKLIHGTSARLTTPADSDISVEIEGGWNRTIQQNENSFVKGDSTHEYDDSLCAEFDTPGELVNTFKNGDVRRYYLNGHHLINNQHQLENIGFSATGGQVTLDTIRFGDDHVTVRAGWQSDQQWIHGDSTSVHVGSTKHDLTFGAATRVIAGAHFESYQSSSAGDVSGEIATMHSAEAKSSTTGLASISGAYEKGALDPNRLPEWNAPTSSSGPPVKLLMFPGANLNLKGTMEFTYATVRTALTVAGGSFRAIHSFLVGICHAPKVLAAAWDVLYTKCKAICARVNILGLGDPRVPAPPAPDPAAAASSGAAAAAGATAKELTAAALAAAQPWGDALGEEQAARIAGEETAEKAVQNATTARDEAVANRDGVQTKVNGLQDKLDTANENLADAETNRDSLRDIRDSRSQDLTRLQEPVNEAQNNLTRAQEELERYQSQEGVAAGNAAEKSLQLSAAEQVASRASRELEEAIQAAGDNNLNQAIDEALNAKNLAQEALDGAQTPEEEAAAQQRLAGANQRLEELAQARQQITDRLDAARSASNAANERLAAAEQASNEARDKFTSATTERQLAETAVEQATEARNAAVEARNTAEQNLETAKTNLFRAEQRVSRAISAKMQAEEALNAAKEELAQAQQAVTKANQNLAKANDWKQKADTLKQKTAALNQAHDPLQLPADKNPRKAPPKTSVIIPPLIGIGVRHKFNKEKPPWQH